MDKTKKAPYEPPKPPPTVVKPGVNPTARNVTPEYLRGTIDPPLKK